MPIPPGFGLKTGQGYGHLKNEDCYLRNLFCPLAIIGYGRVVSPYSKYHPSLVMSDLIDEDELELLLKKLPEWDLENNTIVRVMEFDDYMEGIDFINAVAEIAEEAGHHPDVDIRWCTITLRLTSHDVGGLTELDIDVAKKIDTLLD